VPLTRIGGLKRRGLCNGNGGIRFAPPKSAKGRRSVPLIGDVTEGLRRHRLLVTKQRLWATRWDETCPAVFPSRVGTWQLPSNVQRRFRDMRTTLRLPEDARPHTLRHTYASMLFAAGVDLVAIQELLGHANMSTTRDLYVHLSQEIKVSAADRLQRWVDEQTP
jgi:integrase